MRAAVAYPDTPGAKRGGTSAAAASSMVSSATHLRQLVLAAFRTHPDGLTADEAAELLNLSVLAVRPRVSELHRAGSLRETSVRRPNASGRNAAVWVAV